MLLTDDPGLFCVNAYNYNAYEHTALDPARLYRVHGLPAYGWMVRRRVAEEMVREWVPRNIVSAPREPSTPPGWAAMCYSVGC